MEILYKFDDYERTLLFYVPIELIQLLLYNVEDPEIYYLIGSN